MSKITELINNSHSKFGIKLGLENITSVLEVLGNPQNDVKVIHIAGTNGKGSVSAMIASSLMTSGYSVSKYCSPYLVDMTEMFVVDDRSIEEQQLTDLYNQVIAASKSVNIELTLYEVTTAIMFLFSKVSKVDYLVLEVGLGGRFDATNVVIPEVSVITNISLDHTHILGHTIAEIAYEKAGIIKPNIELFTTEINQQAVDVFKDITELVNIVDTNVEYQLDFEYFQTIVNLDNVEYQVNLFGTHQVANFCLAYQVLRYLGINQTAISSGVSSCVHPARLELLHDSPKIIFDGAHNPASAEMLVESLKGNDLQVNVICSVLTDKDVESVVTILSKLGPIKFIPLPDIDRGMSEEELKTRIGSDITICQKVEEAVEDNCINLICGTFSLYHLAKEYIETIS